MGQFNTAEKTLQYAPMPKYGTKQNRYNTRPVYITQKKGVFVLIVLDLNVDYDKSNGKNVGQKDELNAEQMSVSKWLKPLNHQ